ncbi:N-acetylmuramoyl-L-alanine amidase [Moorena sp. SIO3H5]|uniref:N-acetylmuramoyl-L-alanine amidase n=1 Tax=Moorena sp. SIO3H5 TaxID=2607834 RepID=UPI0013B7C354|nr:N-acetylmuramoyl-L-alanine amidase [Moorena sp. SIO3H5]NEO70355.1 cell wall hydrolase [Moorena sp. SIO3H5]
MKYGIDIGHNLRADSGAQGIRVEDEMNRDVGTRVISKLRDLGHQVVECKPKSASTLGSSLRQRCNIANANRVDQFVSIHFNGFNGQANGTEVFAISDTAKKIAQPVLEKIVELGYFNRKVKNGSHLYVLRYTNMPAILIEICFCDSKKDMELYDPEALANAIVKGLTGEEPPTTKSSSDDNVLELQKSLNRLKIKSPAGQPLVEDGALGEATIAAIKTFQAIVGINQTGIGDSTTWQTINQILEQPILRPNHAAGTTVKYLQRRVGTQADGIFGSGTASAVSRFQEQKGLTADGIVGPQTWSKLID